MNPGLKNVFRNLISKLRQIKAKINDRTISDKKLLRSKRNCQQNKKATNAIREDANSSSDKGLVSKISKELIQLNNKKTKKPIKKWTEDLNRQLLLRRCTNGQQIYSEKINFTGH